ncbi:MAG: A24 family peptidase, partial [Chloroflexota bacterium]
MTAVLAAILIVAAAVAVYTDFKHRRIANRLTYGAAAAALVIRLAMGGPEAFLAGAEGWLLGAALLVVPFVLGWMGAGDVKLLAAFGAVGGASFVFQTALLGCLAGGAMALFYLVREGSLWFTFRHFFVFLAHPLGGALQSTRRMPFGPALAAGAAATKILSRVG